MKLLADTHVLVTWVDAREKLAASQRRALARVSPDNPLIVSEISLLELALLAKKGRIGPWGSFQTWLERAVAQPIVQCVGISPAIAAEVVALPEWMHADPMDRVIVATARVLDLTLLTRDQRIIDAKLCRILE